MKATTPFTGWAGSEERAEGVLPGRFPSVPPASRPLGGRGRVR